MSANPFAALPRTDQLLEDASDLQARYGRADVKAAVERGMDRARTALVEGVVDAGGDDLSAWVLDQVRSDLAERRRPGPRRVINAAGVVVHTNLGRAPISVAAVEAMVGAAGYCDLEFDVTDGHRGSRGDHVDGLLADLTGAEDAMVVNNCAAALVLALAELARGRQVPVSRGQLVEIGGSFRLPEIMAASGARLLEVGTTNRTRASDYRSGDDAAMLLTVHTSNFVQTGFTLQPAIAEVAVVARDRDIPLVHDAGSGLPRAASGPLAGELSLAEALAEGADLVVGSGDKLLGGPQAGIICGRAELVGRLRAAPLARALRVDKLRLAALNATLLSHLRGDPSTVVTHLSPDEGLADRCRAVAAAVGGEVVDGTTMIGGGSAPGVGVDSPLVAVAGGQRLLAGLRRHDPPVVARVGDDRVLLDLRTVDPGDDVTVIAAVRDATEASGDGTPR